MAAEALDIEAIRRIARRRVYWSDRWEDVAQTAVVIGLTRSGTYPVLLVIDAIRAEFGLTNMKHRDLRNPGPLSHPEWVASHYLTPEQLTDRWLDEESEDQFDEWRRLPAAERYARVREAMEGLGTSREC